MLLEREQGDNQGHRGHELLQQSQPAADNGLGHPPEPHPEEIAKKR